MKKFNVKSIVMIIFLSLFITSCTDIVSDDDYKQLENTEITDTNINSMTGGGEGSGDGTGKGG